MSLKGIRSKIIAYFQELNRHWYRIFFYAPLLLLLINILYFSLCYSLTTYTSYVGYRGNAEYEAAIILLVLAFVGTVAFCIYKKAKGKLSNHALEMSFLFLSSAVLLFISGLRCVNTNWYKHDWSLYTSGTYAGHFSIVYQIFNYGSWPDVVLTNQTYQPKLWHTFMAAWMKLMEVFIPTPANNAVIADAYKNGFTLYTQYEYILMESTRIMTSFVGILTIYAGYYIFKEVKLKKNALTIATLLLCVTPVFWYLPNYGNNDSFALFFAFVGLYFALRYRRNHSWWCIVGSALGIGLGMECKLSAAIVAFPVALLFLYELIKTYKKKDGAFLYEKKDRTTFWLQILVFAVIVFPLGLAYTIYAKVKFDMPIGYVLDLENKLDGTYKENWMHIKESNPFLRFFMFPAPDYFFGSIFNQRKSLDWGGQDFNIWTAFIKTSLWGESSYSPDSFALALMTIVYYLAMLLGVFFLIFLIMGIVLYIMRKYKDSETFFFILVAFFSSAISYAYFAYKYPVGCSMNARYCMLIFIPIYMCLGIGFDEGFQFLKRKFPAKEASHDRA